jgi:carbonic anhydrase/acetyltransferase-like protein (isoleucine patch superfamily)
VSEYALGDLVPRLGRGVCVAPSAVVIGDASNVQDSVGAVVLDDAVVASGAIVAIGALVPRGAPWSSTPAARRWELGPAERSMLKHPPASDVADGRRCARHCRSSQGQLPGI